MAMLFITRWYLWYRHPTIFFCSFCAHISLMLRRLTSRSGRVSSWWSPYAHLKSVGEPQVVPPEKSPERSIGFIASFELRIYHLYPFISSHITFFSNLVICDMKILGVLWIVKQPQERDHVGSGSLKSTGPLGTMSNLVLVGRALGKRDPSIVAHVVLCYAK